jgi:hypothetical protein
MEREATARLNMRRLAIERMRRANEVKAEWHPRGTPATTRAKESSVARACKGQGSITEWRMARTKLVTSILVRRTGCSLVQVKFAFNLRSIKK